MHEMFLPAIKRGHWRQVSPPPLLTVPNFSGNVNPEHREDLPPTANRIRACDTLALAMPAIARDRCVNIEPTRREEDIDYGISKTLLTLL